MIAALRASAITFKRCTLLKLAFVILNIIDLALTLFALSQGAHEMNPLVRSMVSAPYQLYITKIVLPVFLAWLLPGPLLIPSIGALTLVFGWDMYQLGIFFVR